MGQATVFPTFINVGLDGSSTGFRELRTAAAETGNFLKRQFERDMAEVQGIVKKALTLPSGSSGALNLDTSGMRQAAAEAERTAQGLRIVARAAEEAARETNDTSEGSGFRLAAPCRSAAASRLLDEHIQASEQAQAVNPVAGGAQKELRDIYEAIAPDDSGGDAYLGDGAWISRDGGWSDRGR